MELTVEGPYSRTLIQPGRFGLPAFFVTLFLVSWLGTVPMILQSYKLKLPGALSLLQILMLFGPGLVACFAAWRNEGTQGVSRLLRGLLVWRLNPLIYLAVLAGPPLVFALSLLVSNFAGFTQLHYPTAEKFFSTFGTVFGVYLLLNTEELAWRGYALPRLQTKMGTLKGTLLLTILWTCFHLPLFWMQGGHPAGYPFWLFALMIAGISLPFTIVFNATGGSILLPHLLHQSFNAAAEALPVFPVAARSLAPIAISVALLFVISLELYLHDRRAMADAQTI